MDGLLAKIIILMARYDMNVAEVARSLRYSYPTVRYYLWKIEKITGLNPWNFFDLHDLYKMASDFLGDKIKTI